MHDVQKGAQLPAVIDCVAYAVSTRMIDPCMQQPEGGTASEAPGERNTVLRRPEARGDSVELKGPVAIDCEMVGVGPEGKYSSLARVCIVNNLVSAVCLFHPTQRTVSMLYECCLPSTAIEGAIGLYPRAMFCLMCM